MIAIDGSSGEGGGQILRTALGLSMLTGRAFRIHSIRARRKRPGLLKQHLTGALAAAEICGAELKGAALGSRELTFVPQAVQPGDYEFAIGTAGSASLVLQAVLPGLLTASGPTTLLVSGGTHNQAAPTWDFLERAFLPVLHRAGVRVDGRLERHGFYPAGGGRFQVTVHPAPRLEPFELMTRGERRRLVACGLVSRLPESIAAAEVKQIADAFGLSRDHQAVGVVNAAGPGNVAMLLAEFAAVTEVFTGFGERGVPREAVAEQVIGEAQEYLATNAAVGLHLADQLLIPLALAGSGGFTTVAPSDHTRTNIDVIGKFLDVELACAQVGDRVWEIRAWS